MRFIIKKLVKILSPLTESLTAFQEVKAMKSAARKPRYDGRTKKRQWEERRSDSGQGLDSSLPKLQKVINVSPEPSAAEKIKRKKYALLMGYSGTDYYGMQRNPNTKTIEEELFSALLKANFISQDCYNQVQNMQFQRAARTDKGVSAARQVVSMKLGENFDTSPINSLLPETIKVFGFKRVTKGFNSKTLCDARTYIYLLPTVAFANQNAEVSQKEFRLNEDTRKNINEALAIYVGTKNFHNFTSKKKNTDPSAKRYIKSFICEEPFIKEGVEFCILKVCGQSFMMHQIRKMIGLVLAVVRGMASKDIIEAALSLERVNVPRAPGLGLVLDYVHYERYNNRYGSDGMHEKLTWEDVEKDVEDFKDKYIFPTIVTTEIQQESMVYWIANKLSKHSYTDVDEKDENDSEDNVSDDEGGSNDQNVKLEKNKM